MAAVRPHHLVIARRHQLPGLGAHLWLPRRLVELIVATEEELAEVRELDGGNGLSIDVTFIKGLVRLLLILFDL